MTIVTAASHEVGRADTGAVLAGEVTDKLGDQRVDLCLLFTTAHFDDELERIVTEISDRLCPRAFIGTTGESVICDSVEYERRPAITLWAAICRGHGCTRFTWGSKI